MPYCALSVGKRAGWSLAFAVELLCPPCVVCSTASFVPCFARASAQVLDLVAGADGLQAAAAAAQAQRGAAHAAAMAVSAGGGAPGSEGSAAAAAAAVAAGLAMPASWVCDHVAGPLQGEVSAHFPPHAL